MNTEKQVMIKTEGAWTVWKFQFDSDGMGVKWQQARGTGKSNSVENSTRHFINMGYTVVEWSDV